MESSQKTGGAADYGVVAEDGTVVVEDGAVGDELHLGHQIASFLTGRGEAAGPCRGVLDVAVAEGHALAVGVAYSHAGAGVRDGTYCIHLGIVFLGQFVSQSVAYLVHVDALVGGSGITVVNPQEGAYLHLLAGLHYLLEGVGCHPDGLTGTEDVLVLVAQVGEAA